MKKPIQSEIHEMVRETISKPTDLNGPVEFDYDGVTIKVTFDGILGLIGQGIYRKLWGQYSGQGRTDRIKELEAELRKHGVDPKTVRDRVSQEVG